MDVNNNVDENRSGGKWVIGIVVLVILVLGVSGWVYFTGNVVEGEGGKETVKIVTSFPMREIQIGKGIVNGVKLALEEEDYKVDGYDVELIVKDGGDETGAWQRSIEAGIASEAVADPDVMVYIGTYNSGAAKVSIPITNQANLAQISPGNTWPGLTQPGFFPGEPAVFYPTGTRSYFRVVPTDALQGPAGAIWAKDLGAKNVYIYDDGEAYGKGIADIFDLKAKEIGLNVVGHETLDKTSSDFTEELGRIKDLDIDLIYFGAVTPNGAIPLAKGIRTVGLDAMFMGPDGFMDSDFITRGGEAAEGTYITTVGVPPKELGTLTEKGGEFYNNYKTRYGAEPEPFSAFGYDAAKVALLAIENVGRKDRTEIMNEISRISNYDGLFGTWSFDQDGDTTLSIISGNRVRGGTFVFDKLLVVG